MDYKLIALFNMGLVYLESGRHTRLWLIVDPLVYLESGRHTRLWLIVDPLHPTLIYVRCYSARWHRLCGRRTDWLPILVESIIV